MASVPPFQLEDQTDEDFFDKLVDDDFNPNEVELSTSSMGLKLEDGNDSDDATAFADLSMSDDSGGDGTLHEPQVGNDPLVIASEAVEVFPSDANESCNEGVISKVEVCARAGERQILDGSEGSGIKEVGWSSFYADSSVNDGRGFGSYSDFLSEFEERGVDSQGKSKDDVTGLDNSSSFANGQEVDNNQYWENLYPGWKYDANTGQWYQVDGHEKDMNLQGSYGYSAESTLSVAETVRTESVSGWNQFSQVNNGYPEHMVFDPQYPGWYYDSILQEWRTLDSYNSAAQSNGQAHSQQVQNGYVPSTGGYESSNMYGEYGQKQTVATRAFDNQAQRGGWDQSNYAYNNTFVSETAAASVETAVTYSGFEGKQQANSYYSTEAGAEQQPAIAQSSQGIFKANDMGVQNFSPPHSAARVVQRNGPMNFSNEFYGRQQKSADVVQQSFESSKQFFHTPTAGRSPDGRPSHVLVSFGFGGKLIVMKDSLQNPSIGSKGTAGSCISVLNIAEVLSGNGTESGYFGCIHQQSFPGPLVGGNVGSKELNKWVDERILNCESPDVDFSRAKLSRLLLSLLKISCQYYGKLRNPFGSDIALKEMDSPEAAIAKLFAFAKKDDTPEAEAALSQCLHQLRPEAQMRVTASEVQSLLVSGRKLEALHCAQEGQLWGPALVIAAQLGDQFYVETVKQMAVSQMVAGSPLRTLCLLIAGQPAEVFSPGTAGAASLPASMHMSGSNSMLDSWEENLAIITANRTKDDELVITHLGDCLWKERSEIIAAHICYLVAEKNFEPYSDAARLCLVGADHLKFPRTYASPQAIQRTEVYEYSKVLGNSQYVLLPFQPYKLVYAHMLAELGKLTDALKYCQAVLKCLKTGRAPQVETWKQLVLLLEDRIRIHQQGGFTANLGPAKLVGKLLNFFDSTAHRVVGGIPPPTPTFQANDPQPPTASFQVNNNEYNHQPPTGNFQVNNNEYNHQQEVPPRVSSDQSAAAMSMSPLMPSASMEPIREWGGDDSNKMTTQARSVSEPDFGRTPKQEDQVEKSVERVQQEKTSETGRGSRLSRLGLGILRKTVGRVLQGRPSREAKLGEENKFYYDEKLKRWVERGVEPPALPPPPTTMPAASDHKSHLNNHMSPPPSGNSSATPPIPSASNQFSGRGRLGGGGVRARYVDTFNQGRGNTATTFQSPPAPSAKPSIPTNAKLFIPTAPETPANDEGTQPTAETVEEEKEGDETGRRQGREEYQGSKPIFPSIEKIGRTGSGTNVKKGRPPVPSRRTASWSGSLNSSDTKKREAKSSSDSSFGDELEEVEL